MKDEKDNINDIASMMIKAGCIIGFFWVLFAFLSIISPLGTH